MRPLFCLLAIAGVAACGSSTAGSARSGQAAPQRSNNVVTAEEIHRNGGHDLQEILRMLRPAWFRSQPTRMTSGAVYADPIIVYVDGRRLGGVSQLRDIPVSAVISVRYYTASEAQGRFGLDHLQGAIDVAMTR